MSSGTGCSDEAAGSGGAPPPTPAQRPPPLGILGQTVLHGAASYMVLDTKKHPAGASLAPGEQEALGDSASACPLSEATPDNDAVGRGELPVEARYPPSPSPAPAEMAFAVYDSPPAAPFNSPFMQLDESTPPLSEPFRLEPLPCPMTGFPDSLGKAPDSASNEAPLPSSAQGSSMEVRTRDGSDHEGSDVASAEPGSSSKACCKAPSYSSRVQDVTDTGSRAAAGGGASSSSVPSSPMAETCVEVSVAMDVSSDHEDDVYTALTQPEAEGASGASQGSGAAGDAQDGQENAVIPGSSNVLRTKLVVMPSHQIHDHRGVAVRHTFNVWNRRGKKVDTETLNGVVVEAFTDFKPRENVACVFADGEIAELTNNQFNKGRKSFVRHVANSGYLYSVEPFVVVVRQHGTEEASRRAVLQKCTPLGGFPPDFPKRLRVVHWAGPAEPDVERKPLTLPCAREGDGGQGLLVGMCMGATVDTTLEIGYVVVWENGEVWHGSSKPDLKNWIKTFSDAALEPIAVVVMPRSWGLA